MTFNKGDVRIVAALTPEESALREPSIQTVLPMHTIEDGEIVAVVKAVQDITDMDDSIVEAHPEVATVVDVLSDTEVVDINPERPVADGHSRRRRELVAANRITEPVER